ncbi:helix-turn-helix domain-containing protein [Bacillus sp. FSL W7-1360]
MIDDIKHAFSHAHWQNGENKATRWSLQDPHTCTVIHLNRTKLTAREQLLLAHVFTEVNESMIPKTAIEKKWFHCLREQQAPHPDPHQTYIPVYFKLTTAPMDLSSFREAVHHIFPHNTAIIWESTTEGLFIYAVQPLEDDVDLEALATLLQSDFYTNVALLKGMPLPIKDVHDALHFSKQLFSFAHNIHPEKNVLCAAETAISWLTQTITPTQFAKVKRYFLPAPILTDQELLRAIIVYLNHHMNISKAASALHLHRNSLQYRLNKFMNRTGLDLRRFPHAAITYFLLQGQNV